MPGGMARERHSALRGGPRCLGFLRVRNPLFDEILLESARLHDWRRFSPRFLRRAPVARSAKKIFYDLNHDPAQMARRAVEWIGALAC